MEQGSSQQREGRTGTGPELPNGRHPDCRDHPDYVPSAAGIVLSRLLGRTGVVMFDRLRTLVKRPSKITPLWDPCSPRLTLKEQQEHVRRFTNGKGKVRGT